ncbi:MAG: flavin-dependent dehydrogenase [Cognaticolwellia sp.]|jgi:flavin-dependent dehydrogenase
MADLVIVGGGPVGLVTAIEGALAGLQVTVLEARTPDQGSLDKACGEGLMPAGMAHLRRLGVEIDPLNSHAFGGIVWEEQGFRAVGRFPHGEGLGVRRLALSRALRTRAEALGVMLRDGTRATGLAPGGVVTEQGVVSGRLIVGADGLHSRVRKWAGLSAGVGPRKRFGLRRHVRMAPWSDQVEVYLADGVECYLTPAGTDQVGVAFLWSGSKERFESLLERFPQVAEKIQGAPQCSPDRGSGPLHQRVHSVLSAVQGTPVALVGDAAGYLDACTGEGLSLGFKQGQALVRLFQSGHLARYPRAHARVVRLPYTMMKGLLWASRVGVRKWLVRLMQAMPWVFGRVLAANDGVLF